MNEMKLTVPHEDAGKRIDSWLSEHIDGLTRSAVQNLLSEQAVNADGKSVKKNYKLAGGEVLTVIMPELREVDLAAEDIPLDIVYEDEDIVVVNKPRGMVVHPAVGNWSGTLVNALMFHCGESLSGINGEHRPGIVHRIDKDTSGLLVVAKTADAKTSLGKQFFHKTTHRTYNALVWGNLQEDMGRIEGNIARDPKDRLRMRVFAPDSGIGKPAITHWRVLERFGYTTLVECVLETGRTHQIRAHMKERGHPIFGDERYGGTEILWGQRSSTYKAFIHNCLELCPRQALHAKTLGFVHPRTGKQMDFDSPWPEDFNALIEKWRKYINSKWKI